MSGVRTKWARHVEGKRAREIKPQKLKGGESDGEAKKGTNDWSVVEHLTC